MLDWLRRRTIWRVRYWREVCECTHNKRAHVEVEWRPGIFFFPFIYGDYVVSKWSRCHFPACNCLWFKGIEK